MKNFKFKWLLLSIVLSIASINTMWAGDLCGFCDKAEVTDAVYIKYSKDGESATQQILAGSGQGDIILNTVTSLSITEFRGITKKHDGNVCAVRLYYKTATTGDIEIGSDNYVSAEYNNDGYPDWTWDSWWLCEQYKNSSVELNILDGLAPGSYWFNFYFSIYGNNNSNSGCWEHQAYWSNNSNNYHMSFTVPSKNLTVAGSDAYGNTVSGSQTGISSGTAYTIRATAKPGYKFNGWTKTSGGSSITIADASSAETTVTFNDYANDATVTASFVRTYAYIEGRFKIKNEARDAETTTYGSGNWNNDATTIQMTYESANERYSLHTHMTPYELSQNMGTDVQLMPYFYIKSSTSSSSLENVWAYRPNTGENLQKLTTAGYGNKKAVAPSAVENSLWFESEDKTGYAVLYFDESHVWYELEQTLNYAAGSGSGVAPATTYHMNGSSVAAAAANTFTAPTGYHFDYWSGSDGNNYAAGASVTMNSNITLTAIFAQNTFTIAFNANGGTGSMANQEFTYNATENLTANAFTKAGCYFEGWAESANGEVVKRDQADGCTLSTTNGETKTLYAKWKSISSIATDCWDGSTYKCEEITNLATPKPVTSATWSGATWGGGEPTLATDVVIPNGMAMTVNTNVAKAKSVQLTGTATLKINANAGLVVEEGITKDGNATTSSDLDILSTDAGTGALITAQKSTNTKAGVQFYTKAKRDGEGAGTWVNQYFGIPLSGMNAYDAYYDTYIYVFDVATDAWQPLGNNAAMTPFTAYNIMRDESEATTLGMAGTLNLPGIAAEDKDNVLLMTRRAADVSASVGTENMFANSWTAPIKVGEIEATDFVGADATIYIFNAGTRNQQQAHKEEMSTKKHSIAGQWYYMPVAAVKESSEDFTLTTIPSQQAFLVFATGAVGSEGDHKLTLDYKKVVYDPAVASGATIDPLRAPKRVAEDKATVLNVYVEGTESANADELLLFEREDFSTGYDNGWEAKKLSGASFTPQLYSLSEDGNKAIDAVPDVEGTILGFKAGSDDNQYTFSFKYDSEAEPLYLYDMDAKVYTRVEENSTYTFNTNDKETHNRFALTRRAPQIVTGVEDVTSDGLKGSKTTKFIENGQLYILRDGRIYNAEGSLVK